MNKKERNRLKRTGFSPELVRLLRVRQDGKCAICGFPLDDKEQADHCRRTNTPRGLLCRSCNTGLGFFNDSPTLLRKAVEYLQNPPAIKTNI